ncbi:uncharacterized protein LOC114527794 [Dendronephthya gigantea]|uniref:uncharacterized protein LOC114527794 n=1 Tax=Dendronephthya gigantea TaxID=151771 RepID=UPI00106AA524|nr:uncharacterized protein LOC114527794 [Dendronephthya gigantea]
MNQIKQKELRIVTLESPKKLYDNFLLCVHDNIGKKEKDILEFSFRDDLPRSILESRNPLKYFEILEQRGKLSCTDIGSLVNYLKEASLYSLLSEARYYQARIRVIGFFQKYLQECLQEVRLDDKLNEKWCSEQKIPENYLKKCQELLRGLQDYDITLNHLRSLFCKGIVILAKSCSSKDPQLACSKLLYMADLFYLRFREVIVDDEELLNIQPLSSGKFLSLDYRGSTTVIWRRRSSVSAGSVRRSQIRGKYVEVDTLFMVKVCLILIVVVDVGFWITSYC